MTIKDVAAAAEEHDAPKQLQATANKLLLTHHFAESAALYSDYVALYQNENAAEADADDTARKQLCLALAHRAEARIHLGECAGAAADLDHALLLDPEHPRSLFWKGKLMLQRAACDYAAACDFFERAQRHRQPSQATEFADAVADARRLHRQSTAPTPAALGLSDWAASGYAKAARPPETAAFLGPLQVRESGVAPGERGLFVTRAVDAGALLAVCRPLAIARSLGRGRGGGAMAAMQQLGADLQTCARRSVRELRRIYSLADADDAARKAQLGVPGMELFRPNSSESDAFVESAAQAVDVQRIVRIAQMNALTDDGFVVKKLGCSSCGCASGCECVCIGLWDIASFVNHSCCPNARRVHVGDALFIHAARPLKAGQEITFAYFDVLLPLPLRRRLCETWSFVCRCERCLLESSLEEHLRDIDNEFVSIHKAGEELALTKLAQKLEQKLTELGSVVGHVKHKEKQLIRASFATAYWPLFRSSVLQKRFGRHMPQVEAMIDAVCRAVPGDETALCFAASLVDKFKRDRSDSRYQKALDRALSILRALYGKIMKNQVLMDLIDAHLRNNGVIRSKPLGT